MSNADANAAKPVEEWVTGDEPMTGPQRSYLETLAREAGEELPEQLTKAQASQMIDRLQQMTGRGAGDSGGDRGGPGSGPNSAVEQLAEEGIVDQQAAAQVSPAAADPSADLPPGHPAEKNPPVSAGEVLSDHGTNPAGVVGRDTEHSKPPTSDDAGR